MISDLEKRIFLSLFNRGGYVLDFSTADFDRFTDSSVGVALCSRYGLSKGKSLIEFCNEAEENDVLKLFSDLIEYYAQNPDKVIEMKKKCCEKALLFDPDAILKDLYERIERNNQS